MHSEEPPNLSVSEWVKAKVLCGIWPLYLVCEGQGFSGLPFFCEVYIQVPMLYYTYVCMTAIWYLCAYCQIILKHNVLVSLKHNQKQKQKKKTVFGPKTLRLKGIVLPCTPLWLSLRSLVHSVWKQNIQINSIPFSKLSHTLRHHVFLPIDVFKILIWLGILCRKFLGIYLDHEFCFLYIYIYISVISGRCLNF